MKELRSDINLGMTTKGYIALYILKINVVI